MKKTHNFKTEIGDTSFIKNTENYLISERLANAIDVAITLGQPLLITGEPGTGKTRLAYKLAKEMNKLTEGKFLNEPLVFNTKTTSTANDLFYNYDAIKHFHDANIKKATNESLLPANHYISLNALGRAIFLSNQGLLDKKLPFLLKEDKLSKSTVVLIDEIDKAPRDFPNDILDEIENYRFRISETGDEFIKGKDNQILILMTSNSEKSLPEAFLRRCIFFHIPFPDKDQVFEIISSRMSDLCSQYESQVKKVVDLFLEIRKHVNKKPPATSELLSWIHILQLGEFFTKNQNQEEFSPDEKIILDYSLTVLLKNKDDLDAIKEYLAFETN